MTTRILSIALLLGFASLVGCGDDDEGNDADRAGVGAMCQVMDDCQQPDPPCDGGPGCFPQQCLTQFTGGYCGIQNCTSNAECPDGSACVAHDDGNNYCFRLCNDKPECNLHRDAANESNCSSSVDFVDPTTQGKACVPPSSGP